MRRPDGLGQTLPAGPVVIRDLGAVATVANRRAKQNLAMAGVANSKNPDIRAALDEESATVSPIYTQNGQVPNVEFGPVREFNIGSRPAVQMVATVKGIATDACNGPSAFHSMVVTTVPNVEGSVAFIISLREGANVTPKPDVIKQDRRYAARPGLNPAAPDPRSAVQPHIRPEAGHGVDLLLQCGFRTGVEHPRHGDDPGDPPASAR